MTKEELRNYVEGQRGLGNIPYHVSLALIAGIDTLEQEHLTDQEQRIFLAAMGREEKICREVDEKYPDKEPYEDSLVSVCRSIERKVKKALWA